MSGVSLEVDGLVLAAQTTERHEHHKRMRHVRPGGSGRILDDTNLLTSSSTLRVRWTRKSTHSVTHSQIPREPADSAQVSAHLAMWNCGNRSSFAGLSSLEIPRS